MAEATLIISSKNYSSWCLRGWLLAKWSALDFDEAVELPDDPGVRAESCCGRRRSWCPV